MDTVLSASNASFQGEASGDQSGRWLAGGGDVNGDGYDDFLVGAKWYGDDGTSKGEVYLILGRRSGWAMDTDLSNADASFVGEGAGDQAGPAAIAGDVNGDGYDDILIGAYKNDEGASDAGQSYLIFGKSTGWSMDTSLSNADASFQGEGVYDLSGYSVAGAGDVNGDGYDDILIGAPLSGSGDSGQTYLVLGRSTGWSMDTDLANVDASFHGESGSDASGISVSGAGDVNGDGYDDILIGAMNNGAGGTNAGQTYLVLGKATGWAMDKSLSNADASFWGEDSYDYSGQSVAGAGDVNGDGYDDILIGAYGDEDGGTEAGQSYLMFGRVSGWAMDIDLSNANASFWGESSGDKSGLPVAGAGDVDGDGYDDILIGARYNDEGASNAGQGYLVLGKATGWAMDTDLSNVDASYLGEDSGDMAGSVAGAGDVNGDGNDDILIGAYMDEEGGSSAGQTYLIIYEVVNVSDRDNDGVIDSKDAFPDNPFEYVDTDGDGMGDNLDPDADGDGTPDDRDAFPLDKAESRDTDGDGIGDNADTDDDGDGVPDASDAFPRNPTEYRDSDKDGIGDNLDADDDNDGVTDEQELMNAISQGFSTLASAIAVLQTDIQGDLDSVNRSIRDALADLGTDFLGQLAGMNASLADDIQAAAAAISADVSALGVDVSGDIDDLGAWLDALLAALDAELARTNETLHGQLTAMDSRSAGFYSALSADLAEAMRRLAVAEGNLSGENADIVSDIEDLDALVRDLSADTLDQLSAKLLELATDLEEFDEDTAASLSSLAGNVSAFSTRTRADFDSVNETLLQLGRLNDIMDDLGQLDSDLQQAQDELDESVQSSHEEQMGRTNVNIALIVVVLVLSVLVLVLLFRMRGMTKETQEG